MFRLAQLTTHAAPRAVSNKRGQAAPTVLNRPMLEKLSSACQRYSAHAPIGSHSGSAAISASLVTSICHVAPVPLPTPAGSSCHTSATITPLPRSARLVTPFMHHVNGRSSSFSTLALNNKSLAHQFTMPKHYGLNLYLSEIYRTSGVSITGALALSYLLSLAQLIPTPTTWLASGLAMAGSMVFLSSKKYQPKTVRQPSLIEEGHSRLVTFNTFMRKVAFGTFISSSALFTTPFMAASMRVANAHMNPLLIPTAIGATGICMASAAIYARRQPESSHVVRWKAPLVGGAVTMISLGVIGATSFVLFGATPLSAVLLSYQPYLGVLLFTTFTLVDTHSSANEYEEGEADHLKHAGAMIQNSGRALKAVIMNAFKQIVPKFVH